MRFTQELLPSNAHPPRPPLDGYLDSWRSGGWGGDLGCSRCAMGYRFVDTESDGGKMHLPIQIMSAALIAMLASACQPTSGASSKQLYEYPETLAYRDCIRTKAVSYANQPESAFDLAKIAVGYCRVEKTAMGRALAKENDVDFVNAVMSGIDETMMQFAAEDILDARR